MFIDNTHVGDSIVRSLTLLDEDDKVVFLQQLANSNHPVSVGFVNQHAYNLICQDTDIAADFGFLSYRLRDGSGLKIACSYNRCDHGANLNGTDFIPELVRYLKQSHHSVLPIVFGTQEPWLSKGAEMLLGDTTEYAVLNGFEDEQRYIDKAMEYNTFTGIKLIILAMGMPKQERVARLLQQQMRGPVLIVCGGAIIDFCAGRFSRAPLLFRRWGVEWLYRLMVEPARLFKRYVIGIPQFFYYMLKNR